MTSFRSARSFLFALLLALCSVPVAAQSTMARLQTSLGLIDIALFDAGAPLTVANFLSYVNSGAYAKSFIHRSLPGFVIQGGGYNWDDATGYSKIPAGPPVVNEFSPSRSNVRGTVAMAKLPNQPNSATTEWFVNLANNAANLDAQNGGFTVFGKVTAPGMVVVDAIAALQRVSVKSTPFTDLPILSNPATGLLRGENLMLVNSVSIVATPATESDRIFNYLEAAYPQFLSPASAGSATALGYYFRYYAGTNAYIGTANGNVYYLVPAINNNINALGTVSDWLATAAQAGY